MQVHWRWAVILVIAVVIPAVAAWLRGAKPGQGAARLPEGAAHGQPPGGGATPAPPPITLDPGHGGIDGGASAEGVLEKDLTLMIARDTAERLRELGLNVALTREADIALDPDSYENDLRRRRDIAANNGSWAILSIHVDSSRSPSARGTTVLYPEGPGAEREMAKALAEALHGGLGREFPNRPHRLVASDIPHLTESRVPAVLVEVGFLSNPEERRLLTNRLYQKRLADTLARAVQAFRQEHMPNQKATG